TFIGAGTPQDVVLRPDQMYSLGIPVPNGYVAYYTAKGAMTAENVHPAAYNACKPSWWKESTMGVWWWGRSPGQTVGVNDLNRNGLDDTNGEDPFPCTLHANNLTFGGTTI